MATHYPDSTEDEFVPNSQSDNEEQSSTDEPPGLISSSEETPVEGDEEEDEREPRFADDANDAEHITNHNRKKWARKRRKHHGHKQRKKQKSKQKRRNYSRNYSRSEKLKCCDIEEIRRFVRSPPCCCKHNCLNKLKENQARATRALSNLRNARFASTSTFAMSQSRAPVPRIHPGV